MDLKRLLKSQLDSYKTAYDLQDLKELLELFHENAVIVAAVDPQSAGFGKDEIEKEFRTFFMLGGPAKSEYFNETFMGTEDIILYTAEAYTDTAKIGVVKFVFEHIWRKYGDKYLIYHDEYKIVA